MLFQKYIGYITFDWVVLSYHLQKLTKNAKIDDVSIFLFLYRSSLANALIMKLGHQVEPVIWSLLVYSLLP